MLSIPHQKFCEGVVSGFSITDAYASAFPRAKRTSAQSHGSKLFRRAHIQAEIARLRGEADDGLRPAVLSSVEIRTFLARVVRSVPETDSDDDADAGAATKRKRDGAMAGLTVRDKLMVLKLAIDLAPPAPAAGPDPQVAAFHEMIRQIRSTPWRREDVLDAREPKKGWQT